MRGGFPCKGNKGLQKLKNMKSMAQSAIPLQLSTIEHQEGKLENDTYQ